MGSHKTASNYSYLLLNHKQATCSTPKFKRKVTLAKMQAVWGSSQFKSLAKFNFKLQEALKLLL